MLKSRGTAHSNQVREFVLTDHGVELIDVYVGAAGVLAGSARVTQQAAERDAELRIAEELARRRRELHRSVIEHEAHLVAMQDQLDAEQAELDRIGLREGHQVADTEADRSAMAERRWADATPRNGDAAMSEPHAAAEGTGAGSTNTGEQWDLCLYVTDRTPKCRAGDRKSAACLRGAPGRPLHDRDRGPAREPAPSRR